MGEVSVEDEWKCFICSDDFETNESLEFHLEQVHQQVKLEAPEDLEVRGGVGPTGNEASVTRSQNCKTCRQTFSSASSLKRHRKRFHSKTNAGFSCQDCPSVFESPASLSRHKTWQHIIISKLIGKAGPQTRDKRSEDTPTDTNSLDSEVPKNTNANHKMADSQEKLICPLCPTEKIFSHANSLKSHAWKFHKSSIESAYGIRAVEKKATQAQEVDHRLQTHDPGAEDHFAKSADCPFCETSFFDLDDFRDHLRASHRTEKYFVCSFCPVVINLRKNFIEHLKSHIGKMFACGVCSQKFATRKLLFLHFEGSHQEKADLQEVTKSAASKRHIVEKNEDKVKEGSSDRGEISHSQSGNGKTGDNLNPRSEWCNICQVFISKTNFARHNRSRHSSATTLPDTPEQIKSKPVDQRLRGRGPSKLDQTESTMSEEKLDRGPIQAPSEDSKINSCRHCGKTYSRSDTLKYHIRHKHLDESAKPTSESVRSKQQGDAQLGAAQPKNDKRQKRQLIPNLEEPTEKKLKTNDNATEKKSDRQRNWFYKSDGVYCCRLCDKSYSCTSHVNRHAKSAHGSKQIIGKIPGLAKTKPILETSSKQSTTLKPYPKLPNGKSKSVTLLNGTKEFSSRLRTKMKRGSPSEDLNMERRTKSSGFEDEEAAQQTADVTKKEISYYNKSDGVYRCKLCDKAYSKSSHVNRHARSVHLKPGNQLIGKPKKTPLVAERGKPFSKSKASSKLSNPTSKSPRLSTSSDESFEDATGRVKTTKMNLSSGKTQSLDTEARSSEKQATQNPKTDLGIKIKCPNCFTFTPSMKDLISHMKTDH